MSYPRSPRYMLTPRNPALTAVDGADDLTVRAKVTELSGRDVLGYPSVREALRRKGRVYVACAKDASGRARFGPGILVTDTHHRDFQSAGELP